MSVNFIDYGNVELRVFALFARSRGGKTFMSDIFKELLVMPPTDKDRAAIENVANHEFGKGEPRIESDDYPRNVNNQFSHKIVTRALCRVVREQREDIDMLKAEIRELRARLPIGPREVFHWNIARADTSDREELDRYEGEERLPGAGVIRRILNELMDRLEGKL